MMNIENFPGRIISGVDNSLIYFFMEESSTRYVTELSTEFSNQLEAIETFELTAEEKIRLNELEKECTVYRFLHNSKQVNMS